MTNPTCDSHLLPASITATGLCNGESVLLVGCPGVGKTSLLRELARASALYFMQAHNLRNVTNSLVVVVDKVCPPAPRVPPRPMAAHPKRNERHDCPVCSRLGHHPSRLELLLFIISMPGPPYWPPPWLRTVGRGTGYGSRAGILGRPGGEFLRVSEPHCRPPVFSMRLALVAWPHRAPR